MARPHFILRAAVVWSVFMVLAPIAAVLACRLLSDRRTYIFLAGASLVAYLVVRGHRPVDRHRSGSIERAPYDITGARDGRRER